MSLYEFSVILPLHLQNMVFCGVTQLLKFNEIFFFREKRNLTMRINGEEFSTVIREAISSDGIFGAPGLSSLCLRVIAVCDLKC